MNVYLQKKRMEPLEIREKTDTGTLHGSLQWRREEGKKKKRRARASFICILFGAVYLKPGVKFHEMNGSDLAKAAIALGLPSSTIWCSAILLVLRCRRDEKSQHLNSSNGCN